MTKPFKLLRSFALLSFVSIAIISIGLALVLLRYLTENTLERDAVVSMEFIQSVSKINSPGNYFQGKQLGRDRQQMEEFFRHVTLIPDVLHANVYSDDDALVWSSDPRLIGKHLGDNPELDRALQGDLVFQRETRETRTGDVEKVEHRYLPTHVTDFVENYIPIWNEDESHVIGVVEVYKSPRALLRALEGGKRMVWLSTIVGGVFLYAVLFSIVRRGSSLIDQQQRALVKTERLATVGAMAASIAHSIRNPIASIRSSAELALDDTGDPLTKHLNDIITTADRFDDWVRELLMFHRDPKEQYQRAQITDVIHASLKNFENRWDTYAVGIRVDLPPTLPAVQGDPYLLIQVFNSVIANALEAMTDGGELSVDASLRRARVEVHVRDTGVGIPEAQLADVFTPLVSYKANGLGIGLSLARQVLEGFAGHIALTSVEGQGTSVTLTLAVAR